MIQNGLKKMACALACAGAAWAALGDWTGAGADTKITTAENWSATTDLTGGTALMKVTGGTRATVPADATAYAFLGAAVQQADFTFDAADGAKAVTLGAQGLTNAADGTTWAWPTTLGAAASQKINGVTTTAQTWYSATGKSLAIRGPLSGSALFFQGRGRVDVYSTNEIATAFVGNSNTDEPGAVQVYQRPGARLVKEGGTVNCSCKTDGPSSVWGFHLMGGTHPYNILAGAHNNCHPSAFFVEAGTTNVLTGSFTTQWGNESSMGIRGYLCVQGGLTATSCYNEQGCWRPFTRYNDAYATGYLKVETKPMTANRVCIPWGTLELAAAGNVFATRGLFIEQQGLVKATVANALATGKSNKLKLTGGTFDLGGCDQGVDLFCGNGGTVTSARGAQLHVVNSAYFFDSRFKNGKPASSPALDLGTNMTVCTTVFAGGAGLAKEGTQDLYLAAANTSTGTLTVTTGRLVLSAANSAATYPGTSFVKTQGSWAGRVDVTGGTLAVEHASALGPKAVLYIAGGTVELAAGVVLPAYRVYVTDGAGGWTALRGTCGGADSSAANKPTFPGTATPVFTGTGTVCVGASLPDGWPAAAAYADWTEAGADKLVSTAANWNPASADPYDGSLFARFAAGGEAQLPANDFIYLQGLSVSQKDFAFTSGAGTTCFLGALGLTNATTGVAWGWPSSIGALSPLWWLAKDSTLSLRAPLSGTGTLQIWGGGRLDVYSTNTLQGTVRVGNSNSQSADPVGEVSVYLHPGATLAGAGGTVSIGCRAGWGLHLMGNTLDCNVVAGTQNVTPPGALYVESGTTNVINGSFTTQFGNLSYMAVAGHLTLRGGAQFQTDSGLPMQRFRPISAATGTLRIEAKPATSRLCEVAFGRLELATAGNLFGRQGLWLNGGRVVLDADDALGARGKNSDDGNNNVTLSSGTFDLNGHDAQVDAVNARGGTVTSAAPASFRVKCNRLHAYSAGTSNYIKPFLATGLVWQTALTGAAGLTQEGACDLYLASVNASTGTLAVTTGRLVLSAYSASETYPNTSIRKTYGAWQKGTVAVSGGTLAVEHANAFSRDVTLQLTGGEVEVAEGVSARVGEIWIDGVRQRAGTYGGPDSNAKYKPKKGDAYLFSGKGVVNAVSSSGLTIILTDGRPTETPVSLRFGVVSDVHITRRGAASDTYSYGSAQTFVHLLEYYKAANVDAVVLAGDMADRGLVENLQVVADAWREVFPDDTAADGRHVERLFIYGNHDADASWFTNCVLTGKTAEEQTSLLARAISVQESNAWDTVWHEAWQPAFTRTVKGYRFILANWGHESAATEIVNRDCFDLAGARPFFYIQHPQLTDGTYASYVWDAHAGPTAALAAYPNAITFSGHCHYSTALEASIHQKDFTSIGTGSLSYIGKFGGALNKDDAYTTRNGREALLVTVRGNRVTVKRREFVKDEDLGPDWTIDVPPADHGAPYLYAHEQARLAAPEFPSGAQIAAERTEAGLALTLPRAVFDAQHARAPFFDCVFTRGGTAVYTCVLLQDGYFAPYADVPATTAFTIPAATFDATEAFTLTVRARDFYGRTSAPLDAAVDAPNQRPTRGAARMPPLQGCP